MMWCGKGPPMACYLPGMAFCPEHKPLKVGDNLAFKY